MRRVLVAGIGNVFLGDDGFGVEVVARLARRPVPEWLRVVELGTRGFDLAFALLEDHEGAVLVDAVRRGHAPGTLSIIEPDAGDDVAYVETHGMDPANVLRLVRTLGGAPPRLRIVGCEPFSLGSGEDIEVGLSSAVEASIEPALELVLAVASELHAEAVTRA